MYVIFMTVLSSLCICVISASSFFVHFYKKNKEKQLNLKLIFSTIISVILVIFSTIWLTSIWLYSKPLTYEQLQNYKVVVPPGTTMTVPIPENIEDTILMFFHRDEYIKKNGKRIERLKEADITTKWNYKEDKEYVTLFNTSWGSRLQKYTEK